MIYLPWIAFLLGIAWMIWQGNKAKREYLRRKVEEKERATREAREDELVKGLSAPGQGQVIELAKTFGGGAQKRTTGWN